MNDVDRQRIFQYLATYQPHPDDYNIGYTNGFLRAIFRRGPENWWITFIQYLESLPQNLDLTPIGPLIKELHTMTLVPVEGGTVVWNCPHGLDESWWNQFKLTLDTLQPKVAHTAGNSLNWMLPIQEVGEPVNPKKILGNITQLKPEQVPRCAQRAYDYCLSPNQKQAKTSYYNPSKKHVEDFTILLHAYFYEDLQIYGQNAAYFPYAIRLHPGYINFTQHEQAHIVETFYNGNLQQFLADNHP